MMAFNAVLEADLRAISAESRRKYPAVKDAAEHAILKLRSLSDPESIAKSEDVLRIFLLACETKQVKLSVLGLSCLQKLIAHDAVDPAALPHILATIREHAEMFDEGVQLKVLQASLTVLQSRLFPEDEDNMAVVLGICLRLVGNPRNMDSVHSTAAATLRQAVALIFDRVLEGENLPSAAAQRQVNRLRTTSATGDVSRMLITPRAGDSEMEMVPPPSPGPKDSVDSLSRAGRLGLRLFEDLHALAAGLTATWLQVPLLPRAFALDMLEYVVSHYVVIFKKLGPFEQVLRIRVCSLLMTSLRATGEMDGEAGEPAYRRLVLRSVATVTRLYSNIMTTECEVFLSMLIKSMELELPLWHRIMVLEVLRGFCVEARVLRLIYQTFDMRPTNTDVVAEMVAALARVVQSVQVPEASEESLAAVAGMFSSKAKGVEWTMDFDFTGNAVVVASEAHAITLAVEGLLGVVFTIAVLVDEAVDDGELESPHYANKIAEEEDENIVKEGSLADMCSQMVNSVWRILLEALSLMLSRSQGEAVVLEILKGYQAFTQACGVLQLVEPRDAFLASLCRFTLVAQFEPDKPSVTALSVSMLTAGIRRLDQGGEAGGLVLTSKNVQALRTLFNISHRLCSVLGPSWTLVLETLAALDRTIHAPHATTQEVATQTRSAREGNQATDFNILSTLDAQLFESSSIMSDSAVRALLAALRTVSNQSLEGVGTGLGLAASGTTVATGSKGAVQPSSLKMFAVERCLAVLVHNLQRVDRLWGEITVHLLELADHESPQVRIVALDAMDRAIMAVLNCNRIKEEAAAAAILESNQDRDPSPGVAVSNGRDASDPKADLADLAERTQSGQEASGSGRKDKNADQDTDDMFECVVIMPITVLFDVGRDMDVRAGALRILLHALERHGEKLYHSWPDILELLRLVAQEGERDHVPLGFQSVRVVMNDCLSSVPPASLEMCVDVAGAYALQKTDVNISLTAVGLLWTTADFFARGANNISVTPGRQGSPTASDLDSPRTPGSRGEITAAGPGRPEGKSSLWPESAAREPHVVPAGRLDPQSAKLLMKVFSVIQSIGPDERPEVRNAAVRTLFQSLVSHGSKLSHPFWRDSLWVLIFPLIENVRHLAATASQEEWVGTELGKQGGKAVHMLVHHSRNTCQKQWDETLVMALGGMSRLLKAFFPFLQHLDNFKQGWGVLLQFVEESIAGGSKEVALAAANMLHTLLHAHAARGNIPRFYWDSALASYERVVREGAQAESRVALKARQEILENLGELYVSSASTMFEDPDYLRVLALVDVMARYPVIAGEAPAYAGTLPQVQRTVLEVLPKLQPHRVHWHLWPALLRQLLAYLPGGDRLLCDHCRVPAAFLQESRAARKLSQGQKPLGDANSSCSRQSSMDRSQSEETAQLDSPRQGTDSEVKADVARGDAKVDSADSADLDSEARSGDNGRDRGLDAEGRMPANEDLPGVTTPAHENGHRHTKKPHDSTEHDTQSPSPNTPSGKQAEARPVSRGLSLGGQLEMFAPAAVWAPTTENAGGGFMRNFPETAPGALSQVFLERVVAMLLEFVSNSTDEARTATLPDLAAALGRCMAVRRDSPDSQLWRTALAAFTSVLDSAMPTDAVLSPRSPQMPGRPMEDYLAEVDLGSGRPRLWRELADVFEKFLLGACGRAVTLAGGAPMPADVIKGDEALEGLLLDALCNRVLWRCMDATSEVKHRLVAVVDSCAARTSALPLPSVALLPPHCGRFSLACLHRLFVLSSRGGSEDGLDSSGVSVGRIALPFLVRRCESILCRFLQDATERGPEPLPAVRFEEIITTLEELANLVLHPQVAASLDVPIHHKAPEMALGHMGRSPLPSTWHPSKARFLDSLGRQLGWQRAHLLVLYEPITDVVRTREPQVVELAWVLLRLVGSEIGLVKGEVQPWMA